MRRTKIAKTLDQLKRLKPRSHRRVVLLSELKKLRTKQLQREIRRIA